METMPEEMPAAVAVPERYLDGRPVYRARTAPEGLATRSQLRAQGLSAAGLTPVAWLHLMLHHQYVHLYEVSAARPVRPLTARQREVLEHGRWIQRSVPCRGAGCATRVERWEVRCDPCAAAKRVADYRREQEAEAALSEQLDSDRAAAARWAAEVLADPDATILDTETTGLYDAYAVQLAVLDVPGDRLLLDTLLHPGEPIPTDATRIHGIEDQDVADAPRLADLWPQLVEALDGKRLVIYNRAFDMEILRNEARRLPGERAGAALAWLAGLRVECAMERYAEWWGQWSDYWGSYTWQRLDGPHGAAGDCRMVVTRLREMAATARRNDPDAVTAGTMVG
ncbi:3'-5' exonuclease [Longispora sp. NPDC051575]|uniref:3'-5' exonuclease n=1 Tax=Longispora sp. NPDC051575 TaxID=3154943 RepID=UPI00343D2B96